ncbi:MAG: DNA adenine methylase [Pyruvatibacter sp.]
MVDTPLESTIPPHTPIAPTQTPAPYLGGKRKLARRVIERIEQVPHATYAEPFVGMGGVFFRRRLKPSLEVINDISGDVATFFRVLQNHHQAFMDMLKWQLPGRAEFDRLAGQDPERLTDLQRAARFFYLQRLSYAGKVRHRSFGVYPPSVAKFDIHALAGRLADIHQRLSGVVIERKPFADLLTLYDRPETLFYLDPPYFGNETDYGKDVFSRDDFTALADQLRGIKGRFLVSINDTPEIREAFDGFHMEEVVLTYSAPKGDAAPAKELIIADSAPDGLVNGQGALL